MNTRSNDGGYVPENLPRNIQMNSAVMQFDASYSHRGFSPVSGCANQT